MGQLIDIPVPHIGDFDTVEIIEIAVQPGDKVKPEDTLLTLESDKATMEIPSPAAGIVRELMVKCRRCRIPGNSDPETGRGWFRGRGACGHGQAGRTD